jgi:ABC-2 type transport system ATP-binding protein
VKMEAAAEKRVRAYSQGMRQRLALARALLWRPKVLLLDEPSNGLDPVGIAEIRENLRAVARDGVTVLVSSHILAEIEKLVDRILAIEKGRLVFDGPLTRLLARAETMTLRYTLRATDSAALEEALRAQGLEPLRQGAAVEVDVAADRADDLVADLVGAGVRVTEARRAVDDLEHAYLRLVQAEARPA